MTLEEISLLIGVASFIGAIAGAALSNWVAFRLAGQERQEGRRKERLFRLTEAMQSLALLRGEYEEIIAKGNIGIPRIEYDTVHARIIGQAISAVLSVDNDELRFIALKRLTPNQVTAEVNPEETAQWGEYRTRNRDALNDAVVRLSGLISDEMR